MHLLPGVAMQPNLELKTQPKLVLGYLPLAFALPGFRYHHGDPRYHAPRHALSVPQSFIHSFSQSVSQSACIIIILMCAVMPR